MIVTLQSSSKSMQTNGMLHLPMPHNRKPAEHQLTIAQDGTILGATENIMGIAPNSSFMTSAYDTVHAEDVPGLKAVSKHFWERGRPDVTAYLRRRTVHGDWVWLAATVRQYIDHPVVGVVINEQEVIDVQMAKVVSRLTRISAILAGAVEASWAYQNQQDKDEQKQKIQRLEKLSKTGKGRAGAASGSELSIDGDLDQQPDGLQNVIQSGIRLDMSMIDLSSSELKMVTAFLTGRLQLEDLAPLISVVMSDPTISIQTALDEYISSKEVCNRKKNDRRSADSLASLQSCTTIGAKSPVMGHSKMMGSRSFDSIKQKLTTTSPYLYTVTKQLDNIPLAFGRRSSDISVSQIMQHANAPLNQRYTTFSEPSVSEPYHSRHMPKIHGRAQSECVQREVSSQPSMSNFQSPIEARLKAPPPLSVLNMAFNNIGSPGIEMLAEILYVDTPFLKTLDIGFCRVDERGILALCRGLRRRKKRMLPNLQGLILSGNTVSYRAAKDLGVALSSEGIAKKSNRRSLLRVKNTEGSGDDEDNEYDIEDEDEDENDTNDAVFGEMIRNKESELSRKNHTNRRLTKRKFDNYRGSNKNSKILDSETQPRSSDGLLLLHLACCSLTADSFSQLLIGLGQNCLLQELRVPSNSLGPAGATLLMQFFEGIGIPKYKRGESVMPCLNRLDLSNNKLGNDGVAALTKSISRRKKNSFAEIRLSTNEIGVLGIETIMNKLYQHNVKSIYLDNNVIGDTGCQLVAASLPTMHSLLKLSLSFNQIGTRGVTSLMRALLGCESLMSLALSGNAMKVSGSIAMGFCLAHHPRLEELELDNCCLSQAAQCHIVTGIISNRWVPLKNLVGFRVAPPMVAIGALEVVAQGLGNEECFRMRRDIQMKAMLERIHHQQVNPTGFSAEGFVSHDSKLSNVNNNASFLCLLDWLPRVPFDEDELLDLQNYFLEAKGGENSESAVTNDMHVVLKHRGDLLANLSTKAAEEIRDINPLEETNKPMNIRVGISLDSDSDYSDNLLPFWKTNCPGSTNRCKASCNENTNNKIPDGEGIQNARCSKDKHTAADLNKSRQRFSSSLMSSQRLSPEAPAIRSIASFRNNLTGELSSNALNRGHSKSSLKSLESNAGSTSVGSYKNQIPMRTATDSNKTRQCSSSCLMSSQRLSPTAPAICSTASFRNNLAGELSLHSLNRGHSKSSLKSCESNAGSTSVGSCKTRITMFPQFEKQLQALKKNAQSIMDHEYDSVQQDIIAQEFAEISLMHLRELKYRCMQSGLDGWRVGNIRRKVLIVDDSNVTRKMIARAFEKANFIVDTAENGMEGVEKLKNSIYDIAFMDINMPIMNGFDATKQLREWEDLKRPGVRQPICALTATYVDDFERSELMKFKDAGLDVMESKPCNIPRLFKVVDDVSPMFSDLKMNSSKFGTITN